MNRLLADCEMIVVHTQISLISSEGKVLPFDQLVEELAEEIAACYPEAYSALVNHYAGSKLNHTYFLRRIVARFVKCNFSPADDKPDIKNGSFCNFEYVPCPLRGECHLEGIVCGPKFAQGLRRAEIIVMEKWYEGWNEDEIAESLHLSPFTVHNHIRNAYRRLGVHSRSEFIKYAIDHNLFP